LSLFLGLGILVFLKDLGFLGPTSRPPPTAARTGPPANSAPIAPSVASAASPTGTPSAPPSATAATSASPSITFSGSSDKKSKLFELDGPTKVVYTYAGSGNFIVDLRAPGGLPVASIANAIGRAAATTWAYGAAGKVYLDVIANGGWKVTLTPEMPGSVAVPVTLAGNSDLVTAPVTLAGGETVDWSCKCSGNFIVELVNPTDGSDVEGVVNAIGSQHDTTQVVSSGDYAFDVLANGPWSLKVSGP
jgi:hypothetical protein